jgi:hypothetical protein
MVDLGINDNVIDWIERLGGVVRLTTEGCTGVFGGEIGANVRVRVVDDLDRPGALYTLYEEPQVFPTQIVGFACGPWETLRVQGVVAILFIHAGAHLVDHGSITRPDKEPTTLFGIGLAGMGVDFSQHVVRNQQG